MTWLRIRTIPVKKAPPPVFRSGGIQGGGLSYSEIFAPPKMLFLAVSEDNNFLDFFHQIFLTIFYWDETILCLFFIVSILIVFVLFLL